MAATPSQMMSVSSDGSFALKQSDCINARVLAAGVAETFQVPAGSEVVVFSATGDFYAKIADTSTDAAVPSADVTDGSASELNPAVREVSPTGYISLIASAATIVTLAYYRSVAGA